MAPVSLRFQRCAEALRLKQFELFAFRKMTLTPAAVLDEFFSGFVRGARPLLLVDYDGTLAPFQIDRYRAFPWPGVREALRRIQDRKKTRIVVVTGRPAVEIAPLLDLREPVETWGLHGFERLHPDGRCERSRLADAVGKKLAELHAQLSRDSFGGLFEAKPNAAVMHWRGKPEEEAMRIEERVLTLFEPAAKIEGFHLMPFDGGIELRAGPDKSVAVDTLLAECEECRPAAYLGDDMTDEAAFQAMNGRGLTALVRPQWRATAARVWLKPPEEVLAFLARWMKAEGAGPSGP